MAEMLKGEKFDSRSLWSFFFLVLQIFFSSDYLCARVRVFHNDV